ncbi:hypothetical protein [Amycolatopsis kentuckyensis]|uniref:hypothetical protein n=1 Tax=Amycolatopsis kentuckyensis TaxID=218823 RepID=UPI003567B8EA
MLTTSPADIAGRPSIRAATHGATPDAAIISSAAGTLLTAQLLAGASAAMIMPVTLAVITSTFPDAASSSSTAATSPATEAITGSPARDRQGVASALNDVTRELGTALGVALLGTILTAGYRAAVDSRPGSPLWTDGGSRCGPARASWCSFSSSPW